MKSYDQICFGPAAARFQAALAAASLRLAAAGFRPARRHPVALQAPEPLDPLAVDGEALATQERPDPPVAVAGVGGCELVHPCDEVPLVLRFKASVALGRAVLADKVAGPTLRDPPALLEEADGVTTARRLTSFPVAGP
jgi:hypothetical protein